MKNVVNVRVLDGRARPLLLAPRFGAVRYVKLAQRPTDCPPEANFMLKDGRPSSLSLTS
jgi:hypothetical protein